MNSKTIAQIILQDKKEYISYDFIERKKRRIKNGLLSMDSNISRKNLLDIKKILDKNEITFWLVYGTLLGAIRDKGFIEWDFDIDIGIYSHQKTKFVNSIPEIISNGFSLIRTAYPDDLATFMRDDEYIDIGIFRKELDNSRIPYYIYQDNREYLPSFDNLIDYKFLGDTFSVPENYENLLIRWYGKSWKKKIRNFPAFSYKTSQFSKIKKEIKSFFIND